ncbi:MAG: hypothetical protein LBU81_04155 [Methanosarcinales archaeon]|jgi:hypothetical protein|nr:hypothetical protein [Methanosarcinales archaeon]
MKMPEKVGTELFVPCGMNCLLCSRFLRKSRFRTDEEMKTNQEGNYADYGYRQYV